MRSKNKVELASFMKAVYIEIGSTALNPDCDTTVPFTSHLENEGFIVAIKLAESRGVTVKRLFRQKYGLMTVTTGEYGKLDAEALCVQGTPMLRALTSRITSSIEEEV